MQWSPGSVTYRELLYLGENVVRSTRGIQYYGPRNDQERVENYYWKGKTAVLQDFGRD